MTIGELAEATGLSVHTLRYYDGEGLLPLVERTEAGHRRFRAEHVKWVGLLDRLRVSGMSIARMREYARLAVGGDCTVAARRTLLAEHEADLRARIAELEGCLSIVRAKLDLYDGRISDPAEVWALIDRVRAGAGNGAEGPRDGLRIPVRR